MAKKFRIQSHPASTGYCPDLYRWKKFELFYNLANFRKKIGLKANIEMLYLPDETFKQRNRTFTLYIGQPIEWESLDKSKKPIEWAQEIKRKVYLLKEGR